MKIQLPLYDGENICLAPIDYEQDPEIESKWTHDANYLRLLEPAPARPLSKEQVKKKYEEIEKEQDDSRSLIYFTIRMRADDRLIGFTKIYWIEWSNGTAMLQMGIGDPYDRNKGWGTEALQLMLRYSFDECNLYRLTVLIPEYNQTAYHLFQKMGFIEEVRRKEALFRDGRRWDSIHLGILNDEWRINQTTK